MSLLHLIVLLAMIGVVVAVRSSLIEAGVFIAVALGGLAALVSGSGGHDC